MAKLTLTIYGFPTEEVKDGALSISVGDDKVSGKLIKRKQYWERDVLEKNATWKEGSNAEVPLEFSINTFSVHQKMYAPVEIEAEIYIKAENSGTIDRKVVFTKNELLEMFANKRASLKSQNTTSETDDYIVGEDFFVNEVVPRKFADKTYVYLKIYSPDKLLALKQYSRSWTAKKLYSDILSGEKGELQNYKLPYDKNKHVECDATKVKHLVSVSEDSKTQEHIFPYLVQYNESFYDMLARTTNRWGEFMYYYDGKLHIGFDADEEKAEEISNYYSVTYRDYKSTQPGQENAGSYVPEAMYDDNVLNSGVGKDSAAQVVMTIANMFDTSKYGDVYWMMKVGQLLTNRESLLNFAVGAIVNDLVLWIQMDKVAADINDKYNKKYFPDKKLAEQYFQDGKAVNLFSEGKPILDAVEYAKILVGELSAADDTVEINYDTYDPHLHLGQLIKVDGNSYIVTEISATQPVIYEDIHHDYYERSVDTGKIQFHVTAVAKVTIQDNGNTVMDEFYPTVIPSGHIRQTGPQVAVVVDVDDPIKKNRVRIKYPWQIASKFKNNDITKYDRLGKSDLKDVDVADASPWLFYASPSGPVMAGVHARHYVAEKVIVNYANNNIERPYVVGAVTLAIPPGLTANEGAAMLAAPNGEYIKVHEGMGRGATAFICGLSPGLNFLKNMCNFDDWFGDDEVSKSLEGGIEMGDRNGIWAIRGSTDGRSVAIASNWGNVMISAFTGININAPNGDINITGKNVNIQAGNNLTLTSGTNIRNKFISLSVDSDGKFNPITLMEDIGKAVVNKLLGVGVRFLDLSILRSLIEVFWRPQEGCLTVRSNRYLKLSAGGAVAGYPNAVYKNQLAQKAKVKGEILKSATLDTKDADKKVEILGMVNKVVDKMIAKYKENYKACARKRAQLETAILDLRSYSNREAGANGQGQRLVKANEVCKTYAELKNKFWDPKTDEITEDDMGFKDICKHDSVDNVDGLCVDFSRAKNPIKLTAKKTDEDVKKFVLEKRKELKANVVKKANDLLHAITNLRQIPLLRADDSKYGDEQVFVKGRFTNKIEEEYIDAFKNAFDYQKCKDTTFYKYAYNEEKAVTDSRADLPAKADKAHNFIDTYDFHKDGLMRRVILNMVEAWGMESQPIKFKLGIQNKNTAVVASDKAEKPDKPKTEADLENNHKWKLYVKSLEFTAYKPKKDNWLLSSVKGAVGQALKGLFFWTPIKEYYSWGNPKAGEILFGVGPTLSLKKDGTISKIEVRYSQGTLSKSLLSKKDEAVYNEVNKKFQDKMVSIGTGNNDNVPGFFEKKEDNKKEERPAEQENANNGNQMQEQLQMDHNNQVAQNLGGVGA